MIVVIILGIVIFVYLLISFIIFMITSYKGENKLINKGIAEVVKPFINEINEGNKIFEKLDKEDVYITSFDNLKLHGTFISVKNPKGTLILMHGYKSSPKRDLYVALKNYSELGFNILFVDERATNLSEGKYNTFGVLESKDAISWVKFVKNKWKLPIILGGVSMGASAVLYAAPYLNKDVKLIVSDSQFLCPYDQIKSVIKNYLHIKDFIFMPMVNIFCKIFAKYDMKVSVLDNINKSNIPILFIHGKKDNFVPIKNTLEVYDIYKSPKELLIDDNAFHGMAYLYDSKKYIKTLKEFIKKHF